MGLYAEPTGDKTKWFEEFGQDWDGVVIPKNTLPVVHLRQGFIALGVAYDARELLRFRQGRPDGVWKVFPLALLREVVPGAKKMKEFHDQP